MTVSRRGDELVLSVRGNAFLRQMVRSLVGTLLDVGVGRLGPGDVRAILSARDRNATGQMAPAHGLTLTQVIYGRPRT